MRSIKLGVPKGPGEKRYNAGLASGRVVRVGGLGSSLPGSQQKASD